VLIGRKLGDRSLFEPVGSATVRRPVR